MTAMPMDSQIDQRFAWLERELDQAIADLDAAVQRYTGLQRAYAEAETRAEVELARVFLGTDGPEYRRKQIALQDEKVSQLRLAARLAKGVLDGAEKALFVHHQKIKAIHAKLDRTRTKAANLRAEMDMDRTHWRP